VKNYEQKGEAINYLVPSATTIAAGDVVAIGSSLTGIAVTGGTTGDTIVVNLCGVYELTKDTPLVITQGDRLFWNASNKEITKTVTDRPIGVAFASAVSAGTTVLVLLYEDGLRIQPQAAEADLAGGAAAAAIVTTVNSLLAKLRTAGIIAS
jgi:predicted RecA/RadA family phage recombinase